MASHQLITLSLLLLVSLFSLSSSSTTFSPALSPDSSEKVSVGLYYESLCPYSANFIINYLAKIFTDGLIDIVDLNLVPWGNAKLKGNSTVVCQHGPFECLLNTVEACAISVWPDLNEHFPFINCIETLVYNRTYPEWESCFETLNLDPAPISDCVGTRYGAELELQYAAETNALQPPHQYVPWVVVDGQPLYEDYENFISYICKAYKGTTVPSACSDLSLDTIPKQKANYRPPVCYNEKTTKPIFSRIRSTVSTWISQVYMAASV